jgi:hypothetical protein
MSSLKDIISLCENEQGKVFVVDSEGELKLVIMPASHYQKMLGKRLTKVIEDIESVNNEIMSAQLSDIPETPVAPESHISHALKEKMEKYAAGFSTPKVRTDEANGGKEEVIDPTFDFEGPRFSIDDI